MSQYSWPVKTGTDSPWAYQIGYFSSDDCDLIIEQGLALERMQAHLGAERQVDRSVRSTSIGFYNNQDPQHHWLFVRIEQAVRSINRDFWNFTIDELECLQFASYDQVGDFYTAHMDMRPDPLRMRKLGISVQLSEPDSYQGNDLRLYRFGDRWDLAPRDRGSIVVFPSYLIHEVTPLITGTRLSLVSWAQGPAFR